MGRFQGTGDLHAHLDDLGRRQWPLLAHPLGQRLAAQFEDKDGTPFGSEERPVQRRDIGVVAQQGERSQLLVEHLDHAGRGVGHPYHLQGHGPFGPELDAPVDGGKGTGGDLDDVGVPRERGRGRSGRDVTAELHGAPPGPGRAGDGPTNRSARARSRWPTEDRNAP